MTQLAGLSAETSDLVFGTLREILAEELSEARSRELDARHEFPLALVRRLLSPEVGLQLLFLPEDAGGLGGGARDVCRLSETMAAVDLGVATAFLAIFLGTDPILVGGTDEQRRRWLGRIAAEGLIVAYGVTEPEAGSDFGALRTAAEPVIGSEGEVVRYRLNGVKQFITNGSVADLYTIMARAPEGPSFFVVERGTPGLTPGRPEDKHGICASDTCSLFLENVEVPAENLLGGVPGHGLKQASAVFGYTRLMVGAFGLGAGQAALDRAIAYAAERVQFGSPLLEKQAYALKLLVPHWIDLAAGRAYVHEIARRIDAGEKDLQVEGSIGKLWASEAGIRASDAAIQALGGYGYTREYMVEKWHRDVRITSIYEGTSEIQQSIIGIHRWKDCVRTKGAFYGEAAREMEEMHAAFPAIGAEFEAAALRGLDAVVQRCHRTKDTRHQIVLFTLANLATRVEVGAALCREAARRARLGEPDAATIAAASRVFARETLSAVRAGGELCLTGFLAGEDGAELAAAAVVTAPLREREAAGLAGQWRDMSLVADALRAGR
ncbi:MAG: acyl-CoA dehydrogenase family protein [Planctomycetota bacterium]